MWFLKATTECPRHNRYTLWQWIKLSRWRFWQWIQGYSTHPVSDNAWYYGCGCKRAAIGRDA